MYENPGYFDVCLTISNDEQTETVTMTDYIHVVGLTTADAGADTETCEGTAIALSGTASNYSGLLWTGDGDGIFSNPSSLSTIYTPGPDDALNGYAEITLTVYPVSPCSAIATDMLMLTVLSSPEITAQPVNVSVYTGLAAVFEIEAAGSGTLEYQWFGPSGEISGADESIFTIPAVTVSDAGDYYCLVQNDCGEIESQAATLDRKSVV